MEPFITSTWQPRAMDPKPYEDFYEIGKQRPLSLIIMSFSENVKKMNCNAKNLLITLLCRNQTILSTRVLCTV